MDLEKLKKIILSKTAIGIFSGAVGALIMIFLMTDPFNLYYAGGFLMLIMLMCIILGAIITSVLIGIDTMKYWDKVYIGFLAFFTTVILLRFNQAISDRSAWELEESDLLGSTIIILLVGFCITLLFARIKVNKNITRLPNKK